MKPTRHRQWAERLSLALALTPAAVPGGYPNLLGPHQRDRAALAYGYKIARLQRAKQRFDPDGVFASATPLPRLTCGDHVHRLDPSRRM